MDRPNSPGLTAEEEERMVARCLSGDASAWKTIFEVYHDRLVTIIGSDVHGCGSPDQAEEIAAAVWFSL